MEKAAEARVVCGGGTVEGAIVGAAGALEEMPLSSIGQAEGGARGKTVEVCSLLRLRASLMAESSSQRCWWMRRAT